MNKENSYYPLLTKGYGKSYINELLKEKDDKIDKLQSNWNSLRELIEYYLENGYEKLYVEDILDKMNELEKSDIIE